MLLEVSIPVNYLDFEFEENYAEFGQTFQATH